MQIHLKNVQIKLKCLISVTDLSSLRACVHFYNSVAVSVSWHKVSPRNILD